MVVVMECAAIDALGAPLNGCPVPDQALVEGRTNRRNAYLHQVRTMAAVTICEAWRIVEVFGR